MGQSSQRSNYLTGQSRQRSNYLTGQSCQRSNYLTGLSRQIAFPFNGRFECWAATTFFGKTSTPFFSILSIPSYTICNKQYTICNSRAYFPLPRLVFDGWRLLSEALFCNRTTCPLITRLRLSQLFCPLLNN